VTLCRQFEATLPPIMRSRSLEDKLLPDQLTKHTAQTLFGNAQNAEQLGDSHLRMAPDEVDNPMVRTPEAVSHENRIRLGGEITIGKKQQLDPLSDLLLDWLARGGEWIYVRHVDLIRNL